MKIRPMIRCPWNKLASGIVVALLGSIAGYSQSNAVIYEGARLIIGDASAPIESGAFVVRERTHHRDWRRKAPSKRPREPLMSI